MLLKKGKANQELIHSFMLVSVKSTKFPKTIFQILKLTNTIGAIHCHINKRMSLLVIFFVTGEIKIRKALYR